MLRASLLVLVLVQTTVAGAEGSSEVAVRPPSDSEAGPEEEPTPGVLEELGSYERSAVALALQERELRIETDPEGKVLGTIHVVNQDVFGRAEGFLTLLNFLHVTTRDHVIEREVLLRPGEPWDQEIIEESRRKLKDPLVTSLVVLAPVRSSLADTVDLLVVTRDVWSLRMNSVFESDNTALIGLRLSVAENNIFGRRKHGAFGFSMDQGAYEIGPQYLDKALAGTRLQLSARFTSIFSRADSEFEGTSSSASLNYPLWSLRQKWGGSVRFQHIDSTVREFVGSEIRRTEGGLPWTYERRRLSNVSSAVRSFGSEVKQRVTMGHSFSLTRIGFVDDFEGADADRDPFAAEVFPRSERVSSLFVSYRLFTPEFVVYRNLNAFDLAEDVRLGPDVSVSLSRALQLIGSEEDFYVTSANASWVFDLMGDGFARLSSGVRARLQDGEAIDNVASSSLKVATPRIADLLRVVGQARLDIRYRDRSNGRFLLGGTNGLRGYLIGEFDGQKRVVTNLEMRSMPMRLLFTRVGGLVFWDMGHVADRLGELRMKHGVGFGLRALVPQLQPVVFRFDWAIPLQGQSKGFPGRITAGVAQVF